MDPTQEKNQNDQPQEKQSGGIGRGINTINKLARGGIKNPLGKIGSRVVTQTALMGLRAFLAGPGLPVLVALGAILFFTIIIIMGIGGAPSSETNTQGSNLNPTATQSTIPTETILTPTPEPL